MSHFIKNGNTFRIAPEEAMQISKRLPVGTYSVKKDINGLFLDQISSFEEGGRIYGNAVQQAERIFNTFLDRPSGTGVLLSGEKGSGKTLLARLLSIRAAKDGIPTVVVNAPFYGDEFNSFIQNIDQPCVVLFDEFEKVYDNDEQGRALTLLDGVYPSQKLFIVTVNDMYRVNQNMKNRPGRLYYSLDYTGLDLNFVREYCNDRLKNKAHIDKLCAISTAFFRFNFDMLKAIVEEMNRYNETPQEVLKYLNAKPSYDGMVYNYELSIFTPDGAEIPAKYYDRKNVRLNALDFDSVYVRIGTPYARDDSAPVIKNNELAVLSDSRDAEEEYFERTYEWDHSDLTGVDPYTGALTLVNDKDMQLILRRVVQNTRSVNFDAF